MHSDCVTTPFGRRSMTLAMFSTQIEAANIDRDKCVDKWKLFRMVYEARHALGVSDRSLTVLNALLSFHPKNDLSEKTALVVFPSNSQLSLRTHGMAGTTLRRHLSALVEAGLILRKDSPNGKRYARRARSGDIRDAFGFSLAPLLVRSDEIERLAEAFLAEREQLRSSKEQFSIVRRDITKLIDTAHEAAIPGDWLEIRAAFQVTLSALSRSPNLMELTQVLHQLETIRADIVNQLKKIHKTAELVASEPQNGAHIQNTKIDSIIESETVEVNTAASTSAETSGLEDDHRPILPNLALVLRACPEIDAYGPSGGIKSWADLLSAAAVVHRTFAITPSAYQRASTVLGMQGAAIALACILERSEQIQSPGAYLTTLTQRATQQRFSLMPMLNALIRRQTVQPRVSELGQRDGDRAHPRTIGSESVNLANGRTTPATNLTSRFMPMRSPPLATAGHDWSLDGRSSAISSLQGDDGKEGHWSR